MARFLGGGAWTWHSRLVHLSPVVELWHRVPWNAVFWAVVLALFGSAVGFGVDVEVRRRHLHPFWGQADIHSGDIVRVVGILNGDEVLIEKGRARSRLRMLGIRSFDPVVNEFEITAFGRGSVSFLEQWVLDKQVQVVFGDTPKDVHGRYLAYLERDGVDINRRMVEEGISMVYTEFPFSREALYLTSEHLAREVRRGIWGGKKSFKRIVGLRHDWAAARVERGLPPPAEELELGR